ncbi:enoyl-CoA hydratase/isomerase family protein [Romboutsia sp.]|uniref:enoyl-CoA hydratase/isomerase family protein n=1 Tax=Romboutsia sp. TaxID=1965302 RepID=UPI003F363AEC
MNYENILVKIEDNIVIVTLNRPKVMNTINDALKNELNHIFEELKTNRSILGIIITGEGKTFCAGNDNSSTSKKGSGNAFERLRDNVEDVHRIFNKIENFERPVIAAINGYALGGGCELALCCDIRIASSKAVFGLPEVTLGVIPCYGGLQRLPRLIGTGKAKELIYTGKHIKAEEAKEIGLVNRVVEPEELLVEAKKLMKEIVQRAPIAVKYAKLAINKGSQMSLEHALELEKDLITICSGTDDAREGGMAFFEKRAPQFKNK